MLPELLPSTRISWSALAFKVIHTSTRVSATTAQTSTPHLFTNALSDFHFQRLGHG